MGSYTLWSIIKYLDIMIKKTTLLVTVFLLLVAQVNAQFSERWKRYRFELVGGIGPTVFLGELGGANKVGTNFAGDFDFKMTRFALNVGIRYKITERLSTKLGLSYAVLRGDDKQTEQPHRHNRNLNFFSHIVELSNQLEFSFIKEKFGHRYNLRTGTSRVEGFNLSAYAFVGLSGLWFNPYGKHKNTGDWVALQPLGTEGQGRVGSREKYSRFTLAIPYGLGVKYGLNRRWSVGLEFGIRKAFTDYLDDVSTTYYDFSNTDASQETIDFADPSLGEIPGQTDPNQQRGDPTDYDSYSFLLITLSYRLKSGVKSFPKFGRRSW